MSGVNLVSTVAHCGCWSFIAKNTKGEQCCCPLGNYEEMAPAGN